MSVTYATLFVCGGIYTESDVQRWAIPFLNVPVTIVVAGTCSLHLKNDSNVSIRNIPLPSRIYHTPNRAYRHLRTKFELWNLPYDRVVYYDVDILVKNPVAKCQSLCTSDFCAVRDPVAQWRLRKRSYFNSGFMVLRPSQRTYIDLLNTRPQSRLFGDQDTLNDYFNGRWQKLPKECNWLLYKENHPNAISDNRIHAVHKP